jgi:hypothetical protein
VVHLVDAAFGQRHRAAGLRIDAQEPLEAELLADPAPEPPVAAVPVAGEDHRLPLGHVQSPLRVQMGAHRHLGPVKSLLLGGERRRGGGQGQRGDDREDQTGGQACTPCS